MKYFLSVVLLFSFSGYSYAQDDLFGTEKKPAKHGLVVGVNGNFDAPAGDMAKRFGLSYRIGPSFQYKTQSNWLFGLKADFIFGNKINEPGFLSNFPYRNAGMIGTDGYRTSANTYERGYMIGIQGGKIFNISKKNSDNGILLSGTAGFLQHKILITNSDGKLLQFSGDYRKGYDRLANGAFIEPYIGYIYFSKNGLVNFHIGLDAVMGFTQGRRDYWFDVRQSGNDKRLDILFGLRGGWYIPAFKRKSEEFFFE